MNDEPLTHLYLPTPVTTHTFEGLPFFLKRDELIHPYFSGNKARKLFKYLTRDMPHIAHIVSYGSVQSNAMVSLAYLAKMRGWRFTYYVRFVPPDLLKDPYGNFKFALEAGMNIRTYEGDIDEIRRGVCDESTLWIEEGGYMHEARDGVAMLAEEIETWRRLQGFTSLRVMLPSGTGTTALFLAETLYIRYGKNNVEVLTVPCVKDAKYLRRRFYGLQPDESLHPTILNPPHPYRFGKLYTEHYNIWQQLVKQTGVVFELLYDPVAWHTLLAHRTLFDTPLLYVHQGGLGGNESMIRRYEVKKKRM
jgi:1-aminocyclopropane-1-carboxylate deaminase/D-cysteine desulfhydrase-like pyridoxal-dependent ACC family enzyme